MRLLAQFVGVLLLVGFVLQPPADVTIRLDDELLRSFSGPFPRVVRSSRAS